MLRSLKLSDVADIRDINALSLGYDVCKTLTREQFIKLTATDQHLFIGYADDKTDRLIGYVHAQVYESLYSEAGLNVLGLAVHPAAQGQGIGSQLMFALEKQAKALNYSFIRLNSGSHRTEAHAFYQAIGYDGDKTQKRFIKFF